MKTVMKLQAHPNLRGLRIDLHWENPPESDFSGSQLLGLRIVRRERTYPRNPHDGDIIYGDTPAGSAALIGSFHDSTVAPLTTYYYTIFTHELGDQYHHSRQSRVTAFVTQNYASDAYLYRLLPAVHQRYDQPLSGADVARLAPSVQQAVRRLPNTLQQQGQLRRFLGALLPPLDLARSYAEGLPQQRDVDLARPAYLRSLAHWVGWELDNTLEPFAQRNEIKFAPHWYRSVGTIPNLRAIVQRYTGWYAQVAEFQQRIAMSNATPQMNIFAMQADGGQWRGTDDAAPLLGFGSGNDRATGLGSAPAQLTSTVAAPFALRSGLTLTVMTDNRIPVTVRLHPRDFDDIASARADEVAAVLNRTFSEMSASVSGGQLLLTSHTAGSGSQLQIGRKSTSLITHEGAPAGRLSATTDSTGRSRLFYATGDPLGPTRTQSAQQSLAGVTPSTGVHDRRQTPARRSAAAPLGFGVGNANASGGEDVAAQLSGRVAEPFVLHADMELVVIVNRQHRYAVRWADRDFATIGQATAAEVGRVIMREVPGVRVTTLADGRLMIHTELASELAALTINQTVTPTAPPLDLNPGPTVRRPTHHIRYKTLRAGRWSDSIRLTPNATIAQSEPTTVLLPPLPGETLQRSWLAWLEQQPTGESTIRFCVGTMQQPLAAILNGRRRGPFQGLVGQRLLFRGDWREAEGIEFSANDFINPNSATALEVAAAINARLEHLVADGTGGTVTIETTAVGGDALLMVDASLSTAANTLGLVGEATGSWGDEIDWAEPETVGSLPMGRYANLHAVVDAVGTVWLFVARHLNSRWQIVTTRWDGITWLPSETLTRGGGGNLEPFALLDATDQLWLFWTQREGVGTLVDNWALQARRFDGVSWQNAAVITTVLGERSADREPSVVLNNDDTFQLYFRSDREGGWDLWSLTFDPATESVTVPPAVLVTRSANDTTPYPLTVADGTRWLLHRSDQSLPIANMATQTFETNRALRVNTDEQPAPPLTQSTRIVDSGTVRRAAGTTTVRLTDATRLGRQRQWDDLLTYTPLRADYQQPLDDSEWYTRGTIGLYLSRVVPDTPQSQRRVERLRAILQRFLPINVRAVVILAPRVFSEQFYTDNHDIVESYQDVYPFVERFDSLTDTTFVNAPDWSVLLTVTGGDVSADPTDLTTLRRRTFFPPLT